MKELKTKKLNYQYQIYPQVKEISYLHEDQFILNPKFNIITNVCDEITLNRLSEGLNNLAYSISYDTNATSLILSLDTLLRKTDHYTLCIRDNQILLKGKDLTALFYAVNTLLIILENIKEHQNMVRPVYINDYASTKNRGIIEGFYGNPWTNEDRIDFFKFASKYKMNSYTFAPKDDLYHNSLWKELYPSDKLIKMQELVTASFNNKINFTWSIHPFKTNPFNFDNYQEDLKLIKDKFLQMFQIGVKSFALSLDDITLKDNPDSTYFNLLAINHAKLLNDLKLFLEKVDPTIKLMVIPTTYSLNSNYASTYLTTLSRNLNQSINIFTTGKDAISEIDNETIKEFKKLTNREPYFFFNFPVNDYNPKNIILAEATCLKTDVESLTTILANPLNYPEASKITIFQILDYAWNTKDFNSHKSYLAAVKELDKDLAKELTLISLNLSSFASDDPCKIKPIIKQESTNFSSSITKVLELTSNPTTFNKLSIEEITNSLNRFYFETNKVITAIETFKDKTCNHKLLAEINPWLNSLNTLMLAILKYLDLIKLLKTKPKELLLKYLASAKLELDKSSTTFELKVLDKVYYASSGDLVLKPFLNKLHLNLEEIINNL